MPSLRLPTAASVFEGAESAQHRVRIMLYNIVPEGLEASSMTYTLVDNRLIACGFRRLRGETTVSFRLT